ncbi:ATP-dependent Clp protease proteolytic subunit [Pseudomonas fluorescens]|uniref:ATP-dependent Clp protease proteolytic subunit n=1 Tax=Pseudomonas fluorescens TaxID=294 RepID=UPI001BEB4375|nr:ATP-dependent Clp protease proteolytic subunit [Pseudomonas fluorescens]MBT2375431.1 ATP-dependent Clp protease proteolytic subunit [Pseudomonas fluorescens]
MNNDEKEQEDKAPQDAVSAKLMEYAIKARKVFITGVVDERMAKDVVQQLHILASINEDPIYVFINSPGGHVESGDMIFDAIRFISPPVVMIGSGSVASAGALIYAAAKKENRYSLPNTRFLLHQPSGGIQGPASNIEIYMKEIVKMKKRLDNIFAQATGQTAEKISADTERDFWLSAEEARDYGLVNKIIVSEKEITRPA